MRKRDLHARIDETLHRHVRLCAAHEDITIGQLVERALRREVERVSREIGGDVPEGDARHVQ